MKPELDRVKNDLETIQKTCDGAKRRSNAPGKHHQRLNIIRASAMQHRAPCGQSMAFGCFQIVLHSIKLRL